MTLAFSTVFPASKEYIGGMDTNFVEKISASIVKHKLIDPVEVKANEFQELFDKSKGFAPKEHTIRQDALERWKNQRWIHPSINVRTPQQVQFAPIIPFSGREKILILWQEYEAKVFIEGKEFGSYVQAGNGNVCAYDEVLNELAINDGFECVEDFFCWFNEDFEGWILHWTPIRYATNLIEVNDPKEFINN
jgi:hypothetical protein